MQGSIGTTTRRRGAAWRLAAAGLGFGALLVVPAMAQDGGGPSPWSAGAFVGQGVHNDLRTIPFDVFGDIDYARSYVGAGLLRYALPTPTWLPGGRPGATFPLTSSVEFAAYGYRGLSRNAAFSVDWRPSVNLLNVGQASWDLAWGLGFWRSLGTPWYNHAKHPEWDHQYKTLFHMTPELVLRHQALPGWALGFRVNHVSGIYGVVAPASLGTNHVGMTLMKSF